MGDRYKVFLGGSVIQIENWVHESRLTIILAKLELMSC